MSIPKIHFLTFGGGSPAFSEAVDRLVKQAPQLQLFDHIYGFKEHDLVSDPIFWNLHKSFILSQSRGFGYWLWKPYLIQKVMNQAHTNDIILYCDCGNELDIRKRDLLQDLFEKVKTELLIATYPCPHRDPFLDEIKWVKRDLLEFFGIERSSEFLSTNQRQANPLLLYKTEQTESFVNRWYLIASQNYHYIDDSPSLIENYPEFQEHRHDQSIFSLMTKKYGLFSNHFTTEGIIETKRNRTGISELPTLPVLPDVEKRQVPHNPNRKTLGFILLRHVKCARTDLYWQDAYYCIRQCYPEHPIVIIDSKSDPMFVSNIPLINTEIISNTMDGRGEFSPYYYFLKHKWFDIGVFIHDTVFIHAPVDFYTDTYKILWGFQGYTLGERKEESIAQFQVLKHGSELIQFYEQKQGTWVGCFGSMASISCSFLEHLDKKYDICKLKEVILTKRDREAFERVWACILQYEMTPEFAIHPNLFQYLPYGILFEQRYNYSHLPVIKVWGSRL